MNVALALIYVLYFQVTGTVWKKAPKKELVSASGYRSAEALGNNFQSIHAKSARVFG